MVLPCNSQDTLKPYFARIEAGAPFPGSGFTFRTYWQPALDLDVSAMKRIGSHLYAGPHLDYSVFHCLWIHNLNTLIHSVDPGITLGYDQTLFRKFKVFPEISAGYSLMLFSNPDTPQKYVRRYNVSGFSLRAGISLSYLFRNDFSLGFAGAYKTIFTSFGKPAMELYPGTREDDFTSYMNLSLNFGKYF